MHDSIKEQKFLELVLEALEPVYHRDATVEEKLEAHADAIHKTQVMVKEKVEDLEVFIKEFKGNEEY